MTPDIAVASKYMSDVASANVTPDRNFLKVMTAVRYVGESALTDAEKSTISAMAVAILCKMAENDLAHIIDNDVRDFLNYCGSNVINFPENLIPMVKLSEVGIRTYPLERKSDSVEDTLWTRKTMAEMMLVSGGASHETHFSETFGTFYRHATVYLTSLGEVGERVKNIRERCQFHIERFDLEGAVKITIGAFKPSVLEKFPELKQQHLYFYFELKDNGMLGKVLTAEEIEVYIRYTCCNFHVVPKPIPN